jgi:putative phage-type endonuclease
MKVWPDMEQRSEAWFAARAGRPTASNFSRLLTATGKDSSQWQSYAIELIAQCIRPDEINFEGNKHTDRGNELEPEARELFSEIMDLETQEVGFITRDDEVIGCSPDALVTLPDSDEWIAGLEIKCPLAKNHAAYLLDGKVPDQYMAQVHGSMAVTGLDYWYFMSYCPGLRPFILRVERDAYTAKLSDALDRFLIYYAEARKTILPQLLEGGAA